MGWWDIPSVEETEIPKVPHQDPVDNFFFDSQDVVHKEFVQEGKIANAEFYNGVIDRLLNTFNGFFQMRSALEIFSCCTILRPSTKLQVFANFLLKKMLQLFIITPPLYSPDLSPPDYFLFSKLKMKLKGLHIADVAEIQEAVTDELKRTSKKRNFSTAFQKKYDRAKACIYAIVANFE